MHRSFVRRLGDRHSNHAIAAAIIAMAKSVELDVVAEGVESFAQQRVLLEDQCAHAHRFLFRRPQPASEARQLAKCVAEQSAGGRTQEMKRLIV